MNFEQFFNRSHIKNWRDQFSAAIDQRTNPKRHGDLTSWLEILAALPEAQPSNVWLNQDTVTIGHRADLTSKQHDALKQGLLALSPWRKGPYELFGIHVDSEWRSDWKWQRVVPHLSSLNGRKVLDVGCGTGYHCWRMLGAGADYVMGIDPSMRFMVQHMAINSYVRENRFDFVPIGIEDMPNDMTIFDTVFSMGVLYHRRNPINHLIELKNLLRDRGQLVLETLIIDPENELQDGTLTPPERYAKMRNVWSIMTVDKILALLEQAGFKNARCVDQNITSIEEQRGTDWMQFQSLKEFLDPLDMAKTIEGYPAPKRGIFIAEK